MRAVRTKLSSVVGSVLTAILTVTLVVAPASGEEDPPPLVPNPNIDLDVTYYKRFDGDPSKTSFWLKFDVTGSVPPDRVCAPVGGCRLVIQFWCLRPDGTLGWISAGSRSAQITGTSATYTYGYSGGYANPSLQPSCAPPVLSHVVSISVRSVDNEWGESESYLLDYGNFPLTGFRTAVEELAASGISLVEQCAVLDEDLTNVCIGALSAPGATASAKANRLAAAVLSAGGDTADLEAFLVPGYVDPIPPAPEGHEVLEGYDLDEIAAAIEGGGGMELLAVMANLVPSRNATGGSTNDVSESVLVAHQSGLTVRQTLQSLVDAFGAGILIYFVVSGVIPDGNDNKGQGGPSNRPVPKPKPGQGVVGVNPVPEAGDSTVNEVLREWYWRIHKGRLGTAAVVAEVDQLLPEESLRQIARQCLKDVSNAARAGAVFESPNPCRDMRILVPAGDGSGDIILDSYEAALHDRDAIAMRPEWAQLNYMSSSAKVSQVPDRWYNTNPYSALSGCKKRPAGQACDEYPYYSSIQGGPSAYGGDGASLRPVSSAHNQAEGSVYGAMVTTASCEMQSAPSVPRGTRATGGTPFLVIPMPGARIPTFFLC